MDLELTLPTTRAAASAEPDEDSVLFIGNATLLLRYGGFTILTDPTFVHRHEKVDLGYGMSSTRLTDPAMEIADLPPIDLVLLSHFHGDHFDQEAQAKLDRSLPVVTTPQARDALHELGFAQARGLDTWDRMTITKGDRRLVVTACPARHGPGVTDLVLPDVMGTVLEADQHTSVPKLYISGDTLMYDDLEAIPQRHPDLDVGFFHLGGTKVLGIMVTMDADQGVEAVRLIDPAIAIPIHYEDYDVFTSPLSDFTAAAREAGIGDRVRVLRRGDSYALDGAGR
ncbi:MBL fold metallo-hydrolase [Knoellia sp. Soil729]|uniref:MBL fold metallo-hydrolase n=1 Tax=Knoellia sp. Soil729 TaxID=1736394 RepID=UPI0006F9AEE7|nr:MBL fold metallo-hydrolase [Knoellia sp. Soil729]KRE42159.1 MBL fold metallo-hydrolase [Knoellia sp. Soil729]